MRNFFGVVESLYNFIEGSTKRHAAFAKIRDEILQLESIEHSKASKTLHSLSATRWSSRVDNCKALKDNLIGVVKTLESFTEGPSYDRKTAGEAYSLLKSIDFDFCLCLSIMTELLGMSQIVSKALQSKELNVPAAVVLIQALIKETAAKRTENDFEKYWKIAQETAQSIGVQYSEPRRRKISKRIDEYWNTEVTQQTGVDSLRTALFYEIIDLMTSALNSRFGSDVIPLLLSTDCLINPTTSPAKMEKVKTLCTFYVADLDEETLELEYRLFTHAVAADSVPEHVNTNCIHSIYCYLTSSGLDKLYPMISIAYQLILTLPVTSCSCERSFSALKFVKNALRSTMSQSRLSDLMILAVEAEKTKNMDLKSVVELFWSDVLRR